MTVRTIIKHTSRTHVLTLVPGKRRQTTSEASTMGLRQRRQLRRCALGDLLHEAAAALRLAEEGGRRGAVLLMLVEWKKERGLENVAHPLP